VGGVDKSLLLRLLINEYFECCFYVFIRHCQFAGYPFYDGWPVKYTLLLLAIYLKFDYVGLIATDSFGLQINLYCMTVIVIVIIIIIIVIHHLL